MPGGTSFMMINWRYKSATEMSQRVENNILKLLIGDKAIRLDVIKINSNEWFSPTAERLNAEKH